MCKCRSWLAGPRQQPQDLLEQVRLDARVRVKRQQGHTGDSPCSDLRKSREHPATAEYAQLQSCIWCPARLSVTADTLLAPA